MILNSAGEDNETEQEFSDGLDTQGFIYKEPMELYWKDKNWLDDLRAFNNKCWDKMACIHIILPNMTDKGQAATPKTARVPHYQTTIFEMQLEIDAFQAKGGRSNSRLTSRIKII
jgi:hypothetical protein